METHTLLTLYQGAEASRDSVNALLLTYLDSLSLIRDDALQKSLLSELLRSYVRLEKRVDSLLKNTLPVGVADEIKYRSRFTPRRYQCTILFTDFVGFTALAEKVPPEQLVETLDTIFSGFDRLVADAGGTKVKTIGDSYMAVFGAPEEVAAHPVLAIRAGLAMQEFIRAFNRGREHPLAMRLGIHTGQVMAGVVGTERMQFDVFGDDVNIASRFESAGLPGRVNVSQATYREAEHAFAFEKRGAITLKNKPAMVAYLVADERQHPAEVCQS